jgi:Na+/H+-dicarboxylate symporter
MAKRRRKKSKSQLYIWIIVGLVVGILSGIALENIAAGFGIFIAFAGFAWIVSGMGMK